MGLDMYLTGNKYNAGNNKPTEDGFEISDINLRLGYWRKHPNLHGFIVREFGEGKDECQKIYLSAEDISKIMEAIIERKLPHTEGFFFGRSANESDGADEIKREIAEDLAIFRKALDWVSVKDEKTWRSINYQASW